MDDDDAPFIRDEENEERMAAIIYEQALGANTDGENTSEDDDDFSAKCLNDSGEGLETGDGLQLEDIRDDDEVPLANTDAVYILSIVDHCRCMNKFVGEVPLLTNHFSYSPLDLSLKVLRRRNEARTKG